MIKGYQGDKLWTAVNPSTGKREIVDPEGEFLPGETIVKLYYCKRLASIRFLRLSLSARMHGRGIAP